MRDEAVIDAVIVAFHPESGHLARLVEVLLQQVARVHVIDNTPVGAPGAESCTALVGEARVSIRAFGENLGVATAFNRGISDAMADGATHVLLSDQDSLPLPGMVERLLATLGEYEAAGNRIAVVGPDFTNDIDERSFRFEQVRKGWPIYRRGRPDQATPVIEVAAVISSGSLLSVRSFRAVGPMMDALFVDYVDLEWCERARAKGYLCLADGRALMRHRMGEDRLRFWLLGWRTVARYGGVRLHYQARNATYLATRPGVAWPFRVGILWFLVRKVYAYAVTFDERGRSVMALVRGVVAGVRGQLGRR